MAQHIIEGTWEEIKRHEAEFIGRQLRVTIKPETSERRKSGTTAKKPAATTEPKQLRGWGMLKGVLSTEDYLREKREDTLREDRSLL